MIRTFTAASLVALGLAGAASAETRSYEVGAFTKIDISAGLDLEFTAGDAQSVTVENDNGDFSDITVEVRGETLVLKRQKTMNWGWNNKRQRYGVTVTAPQISGLEASSGSDVSGRNMSGSDILIDVSSGADVTVTGVDGGTVRIETSSGSDASVSGTCVTVRAESSSGSDLDARDLTCESGYADASSGSDISIYASTSVEAEASSGADVDVYGNPTDVTSDKSSGGSVSIRS
nr:head GIN domain-containing protein [Hyphomonas sp. Mor2]